MGILQKFSESALPLICLGPSPRRADAPFLSAPRASATPQRTNYGATNPEKLCRRRRAAAEGEPIPCVRQGRGGLTQLVRVTYCRRSVGRFQLQTPLSIFLCGRQTFRTGRKMRSSMKALLLSLPLPLALPSTPLPSPSLPVFVI